MTATAFRSVPTDLHIRRLDMTAERAAIIALNRTCDPAELGGDADYVAFKEGRRRAWWRWAEAGVGAWWGAFEGECLIAQCGMVSCPEGRGRFQSVETHPDHRRRGACSALIAAVGQDALARGCQTVHLAADGDGPARALYRRLGFVEDGWQYSILHGGGSLIVRRATPADLADIRSLTLVAAPETLPAVLAALAEPGTRALVAVRSGTPHGHAVFRAGQTEPVSVVVRPTQDVPAITALLVEASPG
ncbi:MAG: GNAT superfamily N-acetyltransferase [Myxococcota bacterium]|jgi:GNAT superfamily N-acetyltransferase